MGIPIRLTGIGLLGVSLDVEYVQSNKDVVRRVLTRFEDMRLLTDGHRREDPEFCRLSAEKMRDLLNLEIPNVKHGGTLEASFKRMRKAARDFVTAAGAHSSKFQQDFAFFAACLEALRTSVGEEIVALAAEFKIDLDDELLLSLPGQDLSFVPGFDSSGR
ncbi:hypothetical protein ACFFOS_16900 [Nocardioides kongjuensis]|uniref:Uncharacterized protein n=1 Tax=Nocardioides kongjuensis TaxID=349522 RepID=A0A852S0V5_9ACTN|nr:hypothetical protein [Nocardioides kongjuensis]NYD33734.1 hypothetical protein [Nocardioides kongjuensis]